MTAKKKINRKKNSRKATKTVDRPISTSGDPVKPLPGPEIMIGLVGPVGTDREVIFDLLQAEFSKYSYQTLQVKISDLIDDLKGYKEIAEYRSGDSEYHRIRRHMDAGTKLRQDTKRGDILAMLAVRRIQNIRAEYNLSSNPKLSWEDSVRNPLAKKVYVLWSLKHPDEVKLLRRIYGTGFLLVSIHTPREVRANDLAKRIAKSTSGDSRVEKYLKDAHELIDIDEKEESEIGQHVTGTFPLADLFLEGGSRKEMQAQIERFLKGLYKYPYLSPTKHELAIYRAKATSMRSADLSRQVGAVVASPEGDVISEGCNEIPKFGGGFYWEGDENDSRDFTHGFDKSSEYKREIAKQVLSGLRDANLLKGGKNAKVELILESFENEITDPFENTHVASLLEFGRPVHAEMAAITNAAKNGRSLEDSILYCTTFPCHLCTRLIVSSGIRLVYYIEPYPKSQAEDLYRDSIAVDRDGNIDGKVLFKPFSGVAPRAFERLFKHDEKRKNKQGKILKWVERTAEPKVIRYVNTYTSIEIGAIANLLTILKSSNIEISGGGK